MNLFVLVLLWMHDLQPSAPWLESYNETASAIVQVCEETKEPLLCSSRLVSLAWFESRFDPLAIGDQGKAHGLYQIHRSSVRGMDSVKQTRIALETIEGSKKKC